MIPVSSISKSIKYYVNKDKGVVVARLDYVDLMALYSRYKNKMLSMFDPFSDYCKTKKVDFFDEVGRLDGFTTKATCSEEDVFEESVGKKICEKRMFQKVAKFEHRICMYITDRLNHLYAEAIGDEELQNYEFKRITADLHNYMDKILCPDKTE